MAQHRNPQIINEVKPSPTSTTSASQLMRFIILLSLLSTTSRLTYTSNREERDNALYLHIKPFLNAEGYFNKDTISESLILAHASIPSAKGILISLFNSIHSGSSGPITKDTDFTKHVHLGTARFWNTNGSFNQTNWDKFLRHVAKKQHSQHKGLILQSTWESYIKKVDRKCGPQPGTGREASTLFSSATAQKLAGAAARQQALEFFPNQMTIGKKGSNERYMTVQQMEDFYRQGDKWFNDIVSNQNTPRL